MHTLIPIPFCPWQSGASGASQPNLKQKGSFSISRPEYCSWGGSSNVHASPPYLNWTCPSMLPSDSFHFTSSVFKSEVSSGTRVDSSLVIMMLLFWYQCLVLLASCTSPQSIEYLVRRVGSPCPLCQHVCTTSAEKYHSKSSTWVPRRLTLLDSSAGFRVAKPSMREVDVFLAAVETSVPERTSGQNAVYLMVVR